MPCMIVVGSQWGDEGKGKIIDLLSMNVSHIVRSQGGNNAGHTVLIGDNEYKLHLIPSGILHPHTKCYIAAGVVVDPEVLLQEISTLLAKNISLHGRLFLSPASHLIFPYHKLFDRLMEEKKGVRAVGTTGRGIGPCYADKALRIGIRTGELLNETHFKKALESALAIKNEELTKVFQQPALLFDEIFQTYLKFGKQLRPFIHSFEKELDQAGKNQENILIEGAQGTFLDTTHGTYPFVTSSNTCSSGIAAGLGIGPTRINHTLGVAKAYTTRVGQGPLPTEVTAEENFLNHKEAREFGTTTKRLRRIGWFDAVLVKTAARLNGLDSIALTKLDVLDKVPEIKICVGYTLHGEPIDTLPTEAEDLFALKPVYRKVPGWMSPTSHLTSLNDLPKNAREYIKVVEEATEVPASLLSIGPKREQTIHLKELFQPQCKF